MSLVAKFDSVFSADEILLVKTSVGSVVDQHDDTFVRKHANVSTIPGFIIKKLSKIIKESKNHFNLEIFDPIVFESFTYGIYHNGHGAVVHNDVCTTNLFKSPARKLTVVVGLNDSNSHQGGDIVFHYTNDINQLNLDSITPREAFKLNLGDVIIFPSIVHHEVTNITAGQRESLVTLILGPAYR